MNNYLLHLNRLETKRAILEAEPPSEERDLELSLLGLVIDYLKEGAN